MTVMLLRNGHNETMLNNVYEAPEADVFLDSDDLDMGALRERYQRDEITVLAVGWFYYFFGSLLVVTGLGLLVAYYMAGKFVFLIPAAVCLIIGPVYVILGYGLRRFDSWARLPAMLAALLAIVIPPAGLLAGVVIFYLLKGHAYPEMFTDRYQTAIISEGEMNTHFGWLGVVGGGLSGLTLCLCVYLLSKGFI